MKISIMVILTVLSLCFVSTATANKYSGEGSADYKATTDKSGFSFSVDIKWKTVIVDKQPLKISFVKWDFPWSFGDKIQVRFTPYGYEHSVTEFVPLSVISSSSIYDMEITAELREDSFLGKSLGFITFNYGSDNLLKQWSFSLPAMADWSTLIHNHRDQSDDIFEMKNSENITYLNEKIAKNIYNNKFKLTNFNIHSVRFDLSQVKKWFYKKNLDKRSEILKIGIDATLDLIEKNPSKQHTKLRKRVQELVNNADRKSFTSLKNIYYNISSKTPPKGFEINENLGFSLAMRKLEIHNALKSLYDLKGDFKKMDTLYQEELTLIDNTMDAIFERQMSRYPFNLNCSDNLIRHDLSFLDNVASCKFNSIFGIEKK